MEILKTPDLFILAAMAEIVDCYLLYPAHWQVRAAPCLGL